jgi:hypothetical protein
LAEEEAAHPANYRGCRHARKEMQKRKAQETPKNNGKDVLIQISKNKLVLHNSSPRPNRSKDTSGDSHKSKGSRTPKTNNSNQVSQFRLPL